MGLLGAYDSDSDAERHAIGGSAADGATSSTAAKDVSSAATPAIGGSSGSAKPMEVDEDDDEDDEDDEDDDGEEERVAGSMTLLVDDAEEFAESEDAMQGISEGLNSLAPVEPQNIDVRVEFDGALSSDGNSVRADFVITFPVGTGMGPTKASKYVDLLRDLDTLSTSIRSNLPGRMSTAAVSEVLVAIVPELQMNAKDLVVRNANFDEGTSAATFELKAVPGWVTSGNTILIRSGNALWGSAVAHTGKYVLGMQMANTKISQIIMSRQGRDFTLSFWAASRQGYPAATLKVSVNANDMMNKELKPGALQEYRIDFTANMPECKLEFSNVSPDGDRTILLNAITVAAKGPDPFDVSVKASVAEAVKVAEVQYVMVPLPEVVGNHMDVRVNGLIRGKLAQNFSINFCADESQDTCEDKPLIFLVNISKRSVEMNSFVGGKMGKPIFSKAFPPAFGDGNRFDVVFAFNLKGWQVTINGIRSEDLDFDHRSTGEISHLYLPGTFPVHFDEADMYDVADINMGTVKHRDWKLEAVMTTTEEVGTIAGKTLKSGLWRSGQPGQLRLLYLRGGKLCFDAGDGIVLEGRTSVSNGIRHNVGVRWVDKEEHFELLVDGKVDGVLPGKRTQDDPEAVFQVGVAVGRVPGFHEDDVSAEFAGHIGAVSFNGKPIALEVLQVTNSGFSYGATTMTFAYNRETPGWIMDGNVVIVRAGLEPWGGIMGADGDYFMGLQNVGSKLSQVVDNHIPGRAYILTFFGSSRPLFPQASVKVRVGGVDKTTLFMPSGALQVYHVVYIARGDQVEIEFENVSPEGDRTAFLDAVTIELESASTIDIPYITCTFTAKSSVQSVYYSGEDISEEATPYGFLSSWKVAKTLTFSKVPGAYLVVTAFDSDKAGSSCTVSGLGITCSDSASNDMDNWDALTGTSELSEDELIRQGDGTGWDRPCKSTSGFSLEGQTDYLRMWAGSSNFAAFRFQTN